jgi:hypothetical protein
MGGCLNMEGGMRVAPLIRSKLVYRRHIYITHP